MNLDLRVSIDSEVYKKLLMAAGYFSESLDGVIERSLDAYLDSLEKEHSLILSPERLRVDKTPRHEEVRLARVESLAEPSNELEGLWDSAPDVSSVYGLRGSKRDSSEEAYLKVPVAMGEEEFGIELEDYEEEFKPDYEKEFKPGDLVGYHKRPTPPTLGTVEPGFAQEETEMLQSICSEFDTTMPSFKPSTYKPITKHHGSSNQGPPWNQTPELAPRNFPIIQEASVVSSPMSWVKNRLHLNEKVVTSFEEAKEILDPPSIPLPIMETEVVENEKPSLEK